MSNFDNVWNKVLSAKYLTKGNFFKAKETTKKVEIYT